MTALLPISLLLVLGGTAEAGKAGKTDKKEQTEKQPNNGNLNAPGGTQGNRPSANVGNSSSPSHQPGNHGNAEATRPSGYSAATPGNSGQSGTARSDDCQL